jgi:FtsZ-interacting cell division protein ZipA
MNAVVLIIIIGIVVLAAAALFAVWETRRRRRARLQERFGPEYEREVRARGSESDAAQHLREVADRRDRLDIRHLEPAARDRYTRRWEAVQSEFVDRPGSALDEADRLITDVMHDRGYPVEDFSERAELVAADHPQVVEHYRAAHAARQAHQENSGNSDTEELRQAFVHYRALFDELVHGRQDTSSEQERRHQG